MSFSAYYKIPLTGDQPEPRRRTRRVRIAAKTAKRWRRRNRPHGNPTNTTKRRPPAHQPKLKY